MWRGSWKPLIPLLIVVVDGGAESCAGGLGVSAAFAPFVIVILRVFTDDLSRDGKGLH